MGRIRRDLAGEPRSFTVWPWTVLHDPQIAGQGIFVLRILDGRRDIADLV
jgi:hypothetical protein